jgi:hypothetical protein
VEGFELDAVSGTELVAFVRALGRHRYVASRLHLIHAFAVDAAAESAPLAEAREWAREVLDDPTVDRDSKDERLLRRATDLELAAVLAAFWEPGSERAVARARLEQHLATIGVTVDPSESPFDETREDDVFPVLVDAGWELLPLAALDADRHRGAMDAFDDFEVARFEEDSAVPKVVTLHELPLLGPIELLHPMGEDGLVRAPFVLWQTGHPVYLDYVIRGVLRAAKLSGKV